MNNDNMSSKERILAAINHEEPDRVPIIFRAVTPLDGLWKNPHEREDTLLSMGVDAKIEVEIQPGIHPDVTIRDSFDDASDPDYRLACREYDTPAGTLRTIMRCTEDCDYADGIALNSNYNTSRAVENIITCKDDLPKLAYLLQGPNQEEIAQFKEQSKEEKAFAESRNILVEGVFWATGGTCAFNLCGENIFYLFQDDPEFGHELTRIIYESNIKRIQLALEEGVDVISIDGCYETAPMWSPALFDKFFMPWLKKVASMVHQAGAKLMYYSTGDIIPHTQSLLQTGIDVVYGIRPITGGNDMRVLKKEIGHRICLWGGLNPEEDVERCAPQEVRRRVADVILAAASGGGFVLSTGGGLWDPTRHDNVMAFIEAAREFGTYPIDTARLEAEAVQRMGTS